jgi:DNA repair exonuclease SbcCD ATPase subunit
MTNLQAVGHEARTDQAESEAGPEAAIRRANQELLERTRDGLDLAIAVVVEQRNQALRRAEALHDEARRQRDTLIAEQDQFIAFLMADHEKKVAALQEELKSGLERLERQGALERIEAESTSEAHRLKDLLEAAYAEIDETRADAARLQGEVDEAIRLRDEVRLEMYAQVEAARDEAFALQSQVDAANRLLEDARDQARDEAFRAIEELDELRRALDEKSAEARRLSERLTDLEGARHSQPPPPAASFELERARSEIQGLRKQLVEAKREQSRISRELELAQMRRLARPELGSPERRATPAGLGILPQSEGKRPQGRP